MEQKKLERWADLLLDVGKRNNSINFRDTKSSTLKVLSPLPDKLLDKIAQGPISLEVFDLKKDEEEDSQEDSLYFDVDEKQGENGDQESEDSYLRECLSQRMKQNQIVLYNRFTNPIKVMRKIEKKGREVFEETGNNVVYLAFGFIEWKESETSQFAFKAPILFTPIRIEHESFADPYFIKSAEDDIFVNPTFAFKLESEYGIKIPEYQGEGFYSYIQKIEQIVKKLKWNVTSECKIGIFSFLKINMYRDLKDNKEQILANENVRLLLNETKGELPLGEGERERTASHLKDPLIELHNVVDADSSQIEAIEMAKSGKSFVLQGPPGTGKSQTITNIIAECLYDGKKVLFVSEKMAALNVVYEKLKQVNLSEFCLELHSHKANKKDVIDELCHTLRLDKTSVSSKVENEIAIKKKAEDQLDKYVAELHKKQPVIDKSLYELYESFVPLENEPDVFYEFPNITSRNGNYLEETSSLLNQYVLHVPAIGFDYRKNSWFGYVYQDASYQTKTTLKKDLIHISEVFGKLVRLEDEISKKYQIACKSFVDSQFWNSFFEFVSNSKIDVIALLNKKNLSSLKSALANLKSLSADVTSLRNKLNGTFEDDVYLLNGDENFAKLKKEYSKTLSRLFDRNYKDLIRQIRSCKKDGKKVTYLEALSSMKDLSLYNSKFKAFTQEMEPVKAFLDLEDKGIETNWGALEKQLSSLEKFLEMGFDFGGLLKWNTSQPKREEFLQSHEKFQSIFDEIDQNVIKRFDVYFDPQIMKIAQSDSQFVLSKCENMLEAFDGLDNWQIFSTLLRQLQETDAISYLNEAIDENVPSSSFVGSFRKRFYLQWIDSIRGSNPVLSNFSRISQEDAIKTFAKKDIEHFEINKAKIRARLSSMRPSLSLLSPGSSLSLLLREGEKKRNKKSIRYLMQMAGDLIQRIKPCFLMSPLSVSTFLAPDSIKFDVVIFDEASQIFPQDAIGAIYRAKQMIVVGDSKQMPPSNFFNSAVDIDDDEEIEDIGDFESILDLCSSCLPQLRLRWHYRSRYESLIAFSNKNFYENDLVTFPSSKKDAKGIGIDYYHVDGVFDRRTHANLKEAEFIVDLIYKNIKKYSKRSLGVVAFSVAQQNLIDDLLTRMRLKHPKEEEFFSSDKKEPFFIKNLETVQGDERDTIIFSVAYGVDKEGRLIYNFGPLNRNGGERRLNVAVTRAKYNVQLVSSMRYTDIDLKRTSSEGARLLREYLDYAENGDVALARTLTVHPYERYDSDFEMEICDFLRSKGYFVDTQLGCSGYRIDLALKKPDSSDYVLAIECDGASYHSAKNARDRDRLRQDVLEGMGWKFYRIWSTDWFRNKEVEKKRLLEAVDEALGGVKISEKEKPNIEKQDFEVITKEKDFEFPTYKAANFEKLYRKYFPYFPAHRKKGELYGTLDAETPPEKLLSLLVEVLKLEAPLSERLWMSRTAWFFGREKVTSVIERSYENYSYYEFRYYGIIRKKGFLWLEGQRTAHFRKAGDVKRDITDIAPEELANGMLEIIKQNGTVTKMGLYHALMTECGFARLGNNALSAMGKALSTLKNRVEINGDNISIK